MIFKYSRSSVLLDEVFDFLDSGGAALTEVDDTVDHTLNVSKVEEVSSGDETNDVGGNGDDISSALSDGHILTGQFDVLDPLEFGGVRGRAGNADVVEFVTDGVPFFNELGGFINDGLEVLEDVFVLEDSFSAFQSDIQMSGEVFSLLNDVFSTLFNIFSDFFGNLGTLLGNAFNVLAEMFNLFFNFFSILMDFVTDMVGTVLDLITNVVEEVLNLAEVEGVGGDDEDKSEDDGDSHFLGVFKFC